MFASFLVSPPRLLSCVPRAFARRIMLGLTAIFVVLGIATPVIAAAVCRPELAFRQVSFSPIDYETMQRHWSATIAVDASRCATTSGRFEILFALWSETAPDDDLIRAFTWTPGSTEVTVDLAAHEAIGGYWLQHVAACSCRE